MIKCCMTGTIWTAVLAFRDQLFLVNRLSCLTQINPILHISLTDEARSVNQDQPGYVIQSWLRDRTTISFLHYWETQNNENFDAAGYKALEEELKSPTLTLTAKKWIEATRAIGLRSKQGKNGGTYAHPEIACVFRAWLHPEYQYTLVQSFLHDRKRKAGRDEQA